MTTDVKDITMALDRPRDNQGKFIVKEEKPIAKTIKLPKELVEELTKRIGDDENFSDKVREAIAFYLKYSGNTHT